MRNNVIFHKIIQIEHCAILCKGAFVRKIPEVVFTY